MVRRAAPLLIVLVAACTMDDGAVRDHHEHGDEPLASVQSALTDTDPVSVAIAESCTTASVKGLSNQLIDEIQCMRPGTFSSIEGAPGLSLGNAVFPWLQTPARDALLAAQKQRGATMTINSALRTLPQQFLLYRWYQAKRCDIGLAASPGTSNHESGVAVDINDNAAWRTAMSANDFTWLGASDPVHFDFTGEGKVDIAGLSVLAFQKLWNRNHPEDRIAEDSDYGKATEERLAKSPVGGFPKGAECTASKPNEPAPGAGGGSGSGALGASGARDDRDGQGCAVAGPHGSGASSSPRAHVELLLACGAVSMLLGRQRARRR
jgi:hypothetical protein